MFISFSRLVLSKLPISPKPALLIRISMSWFFISFIRYAHSFSFDKSACIMVQSVLSEAARLSRADLFLEVRK